MYANATPGRFVGPGFHFSTALAIALCLVPLDTHASAAGSLPIRLSAAQVQYADTELTGIRAELVGDTLVVAVDQIRPDTESSVTLHNLSIHCPAFDAASADLCKGSIWTLEAADIDAGWRLPLQGAVEHLSHDGGSWNVRSNLRQGAFGGQVEALLESERMTARLSWQQQNLAGLPAIELLPEFIRWVTAGETRGEARLESVPDRPVSIAYDFAVSGLGFDSPDGRFAAQDLEAHGRGQISIGAGTPPASAQVADMSGDIDLDIPRGEVLLGDLYMSFANQPLRIGAAARITGSQVNVTKMDVSDSSSLVLGARATWNLDSPEIPIEYQLDRLEMQFPLAYQRYIESAVAAATLDGLTVTGSLKWQGAGPGGRPGAGVLDVSDLTIVDTKRGRFAVTGLDAHVRASEPLAAESNPDSGLEPGAGREGLDSRDLESRFSWRGLLLRRINLGAGSAALNASPGRVSLAEPLHLNVLGGQLDLDALEVSLPAASGDQKAEPEIRMFASLRELDVKQLTEALEWPPFGGTISGQIPGVRLREGVLAVEGEIEFKVFSGRILLSGLNVERPFGVLPSLAANLEVQDLDLQQLTQTFSFGHISGQMSGYVHDLRMLDWKPVAFDAWFGTPQQEQGSHEISRQAVNHLTTLGGGSATAALTGPVMKLFNNFSYKRLGLGCRLINNTCEVRGLDDDEVSVLIMEGAGIPKIMIRAFNREMDFASLVAGLTAASQGESIRIGDKP